MKKTYSKPEIRIVKLQQRTMLLSGSIKSVNSNAGLSHNNLGSSGEAHSRGDDWEDWEDDWEDWEDDEIEE